MEAQYPFVVRHSKLLAGSGGRGQWRGGLGMETEIEMLDDEDHPSSPTPR